MTTHTPCRCYIAASGQEISYCPTHAAAPEMAGWIEDAAHIIEAYIGYSKEMRKLGRGFSPSGLAGHTDEDVAKALRALLAKIEGESNG